MGKSNNTFLRGTRRAIPAVMKKILGILFVASLSACSLTTQEQCKKWKDEGEMFSSFDNCVRCVKQLGSKDLHAVRGCTMGLDAAQILGRD